MPRVLLGGLAVIFGVATLFEGGRLLFGGPEARAEAGRVVEFVLRFNVAAGVVYVVAGIAMLLDRPLARFLASALAATSAIVFAALIGHICAGGGFETRTIVAMILRTGFWTALALFLSRAGSRADDSGLHRTTRA